MPAPIGVPFADSGATQRPGALRAIHTFARQDEATHQVGLFAAVCGGAMAAGAEVIVLWGTFTDRWSLAGPRVKRAYQARLFTGATALATGLLLLGVADGVL